MISILGGGQVLALPDLSGTVRLTSIASQVDSTETSSFDQQYFLSYKKDLFPYMQARLSLSYHDYQSSSNSAGDGWRGELQPAGDLSWTTPYFRAGANYRHLRTRDWSSADELLNQNMGLFLKTRFTSLPQSTLQYDWTSSSSQYGLLPLDYVEKRFQYQTDYSLKKARIYYSFLNRDYDNLTSDISQNQKQHIVRFDYADTFLDNRLGLSSDYLFNYSILEEESGPSAEPLVQIPAIQGLYTQDNTPEFGMLDSLSALIDGNLTGRTTPGINIGGAGINQNVGFDLGIEREISMIHVYTDSVSGEEVSWTVYSSDDNLDWTLLPEGSVSLYNLPLKRYELAFSPTAARYFKVVNSGVNQAPEVYVTEIRAFLLSGGQAGISSESEYHRVSVNSSYQVNRQLRVNADAVYGSIPEAGTGETREDYSFSGTITYRPAETFNSVARYQHSLTDYSSSSIGSQESSIYSVVFIHNPVETMEVSLSGSHILNYEQSVETQRLNTGLLHFSTLIIPGLATIWEADFTRDERTPEDLDSDSWSYRVSADARPYQSLNFLIGYSLQNYTSNQLSGVNRRDGMTFSFNYRITPTIVLRGGGTWNREDGVVDIIQDYMLAWNMTQRLTASSSTRLVESDSGYRTQTFNVQGTYNLSSRTNFFLSYYHSRFENSQDTETMSYQAGFSTSF